MTGRRNKRRMMSEINVVPYIDVMLVLLIIFMITAPLLAQGVKVDLPHASAQTLQTPETPVILTVSADGNYYLNIGAHPEQAIDEQLVIATVRAVLNLKPKTQVLVRGDKNASYNAVLTGMTWLQAAGASSVGLETNPNDVPRVEITGKP
ncbi:MAG: protein TolR [Gammaproteobacteria bacterium]